MTDSRFICITTNDPISFFFYGQLVFHCIYVPQLLYPFICQWTLTCPGYCKQRCSEHWDACVFLYYGFLRIYAQEQDCWVICQFYFQFFKEPPYYSPQWFYQFTFPPAAQKVPFSSYPLQSYRLLAACFPRPCGHTVSLWNFILPLQSLELYLPLQSLQLYLPLGHLFLPSFFMISIPACSSSKN